MGKDERKSWKQRKNEGRRKGRKSEEVAEEEDVESINDEQGGEGKQ
jgi:hypothetical protein